MIESPLDSDGKRSTAVIRELQTAADYLACVELQEATWGIGFGEKVSPGILKVTQKIGGIVAGAFDAQGRLEGFVFGLAGVKDGEEVHWSHMLAVRQDLRNHGIGKQLKVYQRQQVLDRGIRTMFWTYDPLVARNAHLDLNKLGARVQEYVPNMYVDDPGSAVHAGIGMDRFIVKWDLTEDEAPEGFSRPTPGPPPHAPVINVAAGSGLPLPTPAVTPEQGPVRVQIPSDIQDIQESDLGLAAKWRESTRSAFEHYLASGYRVAQFYPDNDARAGFYILERVASTEDR